MRTRCTIFGIISLLLLFILINITQGHSQARGPVSYFSLVQDVQIHSPQQRINAFSAFDISFALHRRRQQVKFILEPNHDIVDSTTIEYLDQDGNTVRSEPLERHAVKVYRGTSWVGVEGDWVHAGWARIYVHRDGPEPLFDGAFSLSGDNHHIQLRSNYMNTKHELDPEVEGSEEIMVVTRDSDVNAVRTQFKRSVFQEVESCSHDDLEFNIHPDHAIHRLFSGNMSMNHQDPPAGIWGSFFKDSGFSGRITKRQLDTGSYGGGGFSGGVNLRDTIGSTAGCPTSKKVALLGIVADCTYVQTFGGDASKTRSNIISQLNSASDLYERSFNISLGLSQLIVSNETCPVTAPDATPWNNACTTNKTIEDRLNILSAWRGQRSSDGLAFWTQLTNCPTGSSVGLAWLGMLCHPQAQTQGSQSVSSANVVAKTSTEWKVIAHEIGHTFGAVHDCTASLCADATTVSSSQCCPLSASSCDAQSQYIMNPSTDETMAAFSPCTIGNVCSAMGRNSVNSTCLTSNKNIKTITENVCGNGIVEVGEECDCGDETACADNKCCDPTTCKFINNAVCDDSNEDCCTNCQFASSDTVCRASTGVCDPEEKCPGTEAACPTDAVTPNGQDCGSGLKCASGQCTSRDQQCKTVMGTIAGAGNSTHACDSTSCQLTCASPQFGTMCYGLQQWFLDGTPCGGGGQCKQGACSGSNILNDVKSWIDTHLTLVIGLAAGIGGLFVLLFLCCCFRSCMRRRQMRKYPPMPAAYVTPQDMPYMRQPESPIYARGPNMPYDIPPAFPYASSNTGSGRGFQNPYEQPMFMDERPPQRSVRYA